MRKGVQQLMLGKAVQGEASAESVLKRIREAGYDGIELNCYMIQPTSVMVQLLTAAAGMPSGRGGKLDWAALTRQASLEAISLHTDLGSLEKQTDRHLRKAKELNTDTIVITGMYRFDYSDEETVKELAKRLNSRGRELKENGIELLYHNHNAELLKTASGKTAYEVLLDNTDPEYVNFEFDSYWFTDGGANAEKWMEKLGTRMKMWHITDRTVRKPGTAITPILRADSTELGYGIMDLDGLWKTAEKNQVKAVILESHKNWIDNDPLKSLETSARWLQEKSRTAFMTDASGNQEAERK